MGIVEYQNITKADRDDAFRAAANYAQTFVDLIARQPDLFGTPGLQALILRSSSKLRGVQRVMIFDINLRIVAASEPDQIGRVADTLSIRHFRYWDSMRCSRFDFTRKADLNNSFRLIGTSNKERRMTAKTAFTAEEWATLRNTPNLVASAMMLAGNSGLFGSFKESFAMAQSMFQGLSSTNELIKSLSAREEISEAQTFVRSQVSFSEAAQAPTKFSGLATAGTTSAVNILKAKGSADDVSSYKTWLIDIADKISKSAKEGGFLGFGGELVSAGEQTFMQALKTATGSMA